MSLPDTQDTAAPEINGGRLLLSVICEKAALSYLALTLLCAALFLPGLATIPPTDRDESRFMQATKQMVETGDWVHIRFQDEPRNKKPVGIYWLQAASVQIFRRDLTTAWPYRIPSALAAWLAVLAVCRAGRRLLNPEAGLIAGAVLATSFIVVVEAHIAKTDAALLAATTVAMTALAEIYLRRSLTLGTALVFWAAIGVGILIKGPVILLVVSTTIAALCIADRNTRWLKDLRTLAGIPVVLLIVLPWLIAVSGAEQGSFVADSLRQDLLPKLIGGQESHGAPPGSYLLAGLLTAWPWSALAPFAVILAWKHRATPIVRFCLAWLIPPWIIFELVPTKLPHYTLPLYPALALLIAWALTATDATGNFQRWVGRGPGLAYRTAWACLAVALGVGFAIADRRFGDGVGGVGSMAGITALVLTGLFVLVGFARGTARSSALGLTALGTALSLALTAGIVPHLGALAIAPRLAEAIAHRDAPPVALAGFHEPSAVFLLGTATLLTDTAGATARILAGSGAIAVIPDDALETVRAAVTAAGRTLSEIDEVVGFNYSRGAWVRLAVIKAEP